MRPCTRRIAPAEKVIKATSLDDLLVEHAPWCRTAPATLLIHTKPLPIGGDPGDCAVGQPVERRDRELEMLVAGVLELCVGQAAEALHEQHHGRHTGAGDLGGIVEWPGRKAMGCAGNGSARL